jgi:hypothetical protein
VKGTGPLPDTELVLETLKPEQSADWQRFLRTSINGTLFHDLDFLSYHPAGRFDWHHLVMKTSDEIVGVLPAGIIEQHDGRWLVSPVGASVGGPVLQPRSSARLVMRLIEAIQGYARSTGIAGVRMTVGPSIYSSPPTDSLGFALAASGFGLEQRWLTHFVSIDPDKDGFSTTRRQELRRGIEAGIQVRQALAADLGEFHEILTDSHARHHSTPTHTQDEIASIMATLPERARLFAGWLDGRMIAGTLVLQINDSVANTFYISERPEARGKHGPAVVLKHVFDVLAREGTRYVELGPSSFDDYAINPGVAFFKESLGAFGVCRDRWSWSAG